MADSLYQFMGELVRLEEYCALDATALSAVLAAGEVRPDEVQALAVDAIEKVNPVLNAVADGPFNEPLEYDPRGPFGGVPFVLKDLTCHPGGQRMRFGTRLTGEGVTFANDTHLMQRFRKAGLAAMALATTPELGFNSNTEALVYGSTRNPWDTARSPGGSSGGSSALVAAGAVPLAHANDGGGSIRNPAACNGLVGLKPSRGRVPIGPDYQEAVSGFAIEFAVTRTVRDTAGMLDAVAGPMPGDKFRIEPPKRPYRDEVGADPGCLRIAIHTDSWASSDVDPEVRAAVHQVARDLESLGHTVEEATPEFEWEPFITSLVTYWCAFLGEGVEALSAMSGLKPGADTLEQTTLACYERYLQLTAHDLAAASSVANTVSRTVGDFFEEWDVLVTPTTNHPPLTLGTLDQNADLDPESWTRRIFDEFSFMPLFNVTGTPAMSLPLAMSQGGLPIGVQFAAGMCEESRLLQLASQLESALPWHHRKPTTHASR